MSITTRAGYRRNVLAKKYMKEVFKKTGNKITLRQAVKEQLVIESLIRALAPIKQTDKKVKILKAVGILMDLAVDLK